MIGNSDPSKGNISDLSLLYLLHVIEFALEHLSASPWELTPSPKCFCLAGSRDTPSAQKQKSGTEEAGMGPGIRGEKLKTPEGPCGKALTWWRALVSLPCSLPAVQAGAVARNERLDGASSPNARRCQEGCSAVHLTLYGIHLQNGRREGWNCKKS